MRYRGRSADIGSWRCRRAEASSRSCPTIEIKYLRTGPYVDHGREIQDGADFAVVSVADLRWYYFLSDLSFTIDDVVLTPPWSWTPVFDFLWSMNGVLGQLERGEHSAVGFTENAELIEFAPIGERVKVSCTQGPGKVVKVSDLVALR